MDPTVYHTISTSPITPKNPVIRPREGYGFVRYFRLYYLPEQPRLSGKFNVSKTSQVHLHLHLPKRRNRHPTGRVPSFTNLQGLLPDSGWPCRGKLGL